MILELIIKTLLKKKKQDPNKLVAKKPDEDFIPYVCHYDPSTILTKNGELMQIIRITGFSNNSAVTELISLRDTVRDAIIENVKDNKFAFWFSTIRRKKNIVPKGKFPDFFSQKVNEAWAKENKWDDQYVNELYVTIITEGFDTSIINVNSFLRSFSYMATKSLHKNFLENAHAKLSELTKNILKETQDYGGKLLGVVEWEGALYSEPMRFFGKIVNLYETRYPLVANDISNELASHKMAFGDREMQVIGHSNKNFATMLSLKEYFEVSTEELDHILQLPFEFIITQSFDFAFGKKELEPFEYQDYLLQVSGDEDFRQLSGSANFIESKRGLPTDYGKLQTTIMLIAHTHEDLERDVKAALEKLNDLGFAVVREDLYSEHCFWSQLPGNFRYLCRQKLINTYRVAGFAALHSFPTGTIDGNYWGPAVTALKTVLNTPYFFNFHDGKLGHALILGPQDSGKAVLLNFLVAQSRKFGGKIFYFDFNQRAKAFITALQGKYYQISPENNSLLMNPLALGNKEDRKNFLAEFFVSLVYFSKDPIPEEEINRIPDFVDRLIASKVQDFSSAIEIFNASETQNIYEKLQVWSGENFSYIFGATEEISWSDQIMAFDLTEFFNQKPILIPIVTYLMHRVESALDGSPSIIALNEAWDLVDNPILGPVFGEFLTRMKEKNCVVLMTSENIAQVAASELSPVIKENLATQIFLPNEAPDECYKTIFGLNNEEMEIVKVMQSEDRHFLFKRGSDAVITSINLSKMVEYLKIFSADETTLAALEEVIAANKNEGEPDPSVEVWLPQLFEVLQELEKERRAEEKEKDRQERIAYLRSMKEKLGDDRSD